MKKYLFLVHHADYDRFLEDLRRLGVVHVREREGEPPPEYSDLVRQERQVAEVIRLLEQRQVTPAPKEGQDGMAVVQAVRELQEELENARQQINLLNKELAGLAPWGDFSPETVVLLREADLEVRFFICPVKKFDEAWKTRYYLETISAAPPNQYFVILARRGEAVNIEAEEIGMPERSAAEVRALQEAAHKHMGDLEARLDEHAAHHLTLLGTTLRRLRDEADLASVWNNTGQEVDGQVMLLEGFVPQTREKELQAFFHNRDTLFMAEKPRTEDKPPILLKNSRFARLFEPIGNLFALPGYAELDLTPFFAPFFMMFFGFCLGDAGYGLVVLLGATLYKPRAQKNLKPVLTLGQFLGVATIIFGALTGTVFGLNLLDDQYAWLGKIQTAMLDSDEAFRLALVLGMVQILFGLILQAANRTRQFGWKYAVPVYGWLVLLLSLLDLGVLKLTGPVSTYTAWSGVAIIILFNDPDVGILTRIGKGIWELYSLTGFFGDLLSYIRLFALGISSAILGFVINDISLQIKDAIPVLGPVLFVLFLVVGHTANLLISSLGSFVHPMRLTFVEFYKNAGFVGGGTPYKPFASNALAEEKADVKETTTN